MSGKNMSISSPVGELEILVRCREYEKCRKAMEKGSSPPRSCPLVEHIADAVGAHYTDIKEKVSNPSLVGEYDRLRCISYTDIHTKPLEWQIKRPYSEPKEKKKVEFGEED